MPLPEDGQNGKFNVILTSKGNIRKNTLKILLTLITVEKLPGNYQDLE